MAAGDGREALLRVASRLSIELGYADGEDLPAVRSLRGEETTQMDFLDAEDELLVTEVRLGLARMAHALGAAARAEASQRLVSAALDGAEMTMRGELMSGRSEQLPALMPSFVFLVALPIVPQDRAFELSRRAFELLEET